MKTQISILINGSKDVKRNLENPKYINAPKSTSFGDYAGTNSKTRRQVASSVLEENPDKINIEICGLEISLPKRQSTTGKTAWYETLITEEEYMKIFGYSAKPFDTYEGRFNLVIHGDMTVWVSKYARKTANSQWKLRGYDYIGEEFVTIL